MRREIPYLQAAMYYSVYHMNILMTTFLTFSKISGHFAKIFIKFLKARQFFSNTFRKFPKITEDDLRFPRKNR